MSETETRLAPGARARLTADTPEDWHEKRRRGFEFEVEEFVRAPRPGERGHGDPDTIQADFYYGSVDGGINNVCVPAGIVEEAMSAEAMRARAIPSLRQATELVLDGLMRADEDGADVFEASREGEDTAPYVEAYGRTGEGLGFGMRVAVLEVWRTDD